MLKRTTNLAKPRLGSLPRGNVSARSETSLSQVLAQRFQPHQRQGYQRNRCGCETFLPFCTVLPCHKFGTSIYSTPVLLLLRLFYQASPFQLVTGSTYHRIVSSDQKRYGDQLHLLGNNAPRQKALKAISSTRPHVFCSYEEHTTSAWLQTLSSRPSTYSSCKVVSITWVKALGSPVSHEYIQFVVEDVATGTRTRVLSERHESGDWVFVGWDWNSTKNNRGHPDIPLPLISLTFETLETRPNVTQLAKILAEVTAGRPKFSLMKEMCWWYSEAVFEAAHNKFEGKLKEWRWANLRYSFVVRTSLIQRRQLVKEALEFKNQNTGSMDY